MSRDLTANVLTEIAKDNTFPFYLVEVDFDDDVDPIPQDNTVRLTSAYNDIEWNGETWSAVGHFLTFSPVQETVESRITKLNVSLSAVDQTRISDLFTMEYLNRPLRIYLGFIDVSDYSIIVDPVLLFDGLMSSPRINEDPDKGSSTISVEVVDHWESFNVKPGRHTNSDEQQAIFPGDKGFEFVAKIPSTLKWGRPD